jgi:hypothetical protein
MFHVPPLPSEPPSVLKPAFLGGVALGVLSALPLVNCCCLLWLGAGGFWPSILASGLCRRDCRRVGREGGLSCRDDWGAILADPGVADFVHQSTQRTEQIQQLQQLLQNQNLPAEILQFVERLLGDPFNPFFLIGGLVFKAFACGIFTTLGGVMGAAFWGKPKNR